MCNDPCELLTLEELCETLIIGKNTAYILLQTGEIKAFRTGRIWKIPMLSVQEYILRKSGLIRR